MVIPVVSKSVLSKCQVIYFSFTKYFNYLPYFQGSTFYPCYLKLIRSTHIWYLEKMFSIYLKPLVFSVWIFFIPTKLLF